MAYTIRYRTFRPGGKTALIVTDDDGTAYLLCGGCLHCAIRGAHASARLAALLSRTATWHPVPPVSPYALPELCALLDPRLTAAQAA